MWGQVIRNAGPLGGVPDIACNPTRATGGLTAGITRVSRWVGYCPARSPRVWSRGMGGERIAVQTPWLSGLEPQACWGHFDALTRIARPSRQEEAVSDHVRAWADQHGF